MTNWGSYKYIVMPFTLKNAPTLFSCVVVTAFKYFIHMFLEVYLDDWTIFSLLKKHVQKKRLMLDMCRQLKVSMNLKKCILCSLFVVLLGHILYKDRLIVDPKKNVVIVDLVSLATFKQLHTTLGHTRY